MTAREELSAKLDELTDEQIAAVLRYVEAMQTTALPKDYDAANDPAIGFFSADPDCASRTEEILHRGDVDINNDPSVGFLSGPTDLSSRAKEILRSEITSRSGWTQKKD
jgi:hypothetical protein